MKVEAEDLGQTTTVRTFLIADVRGYTAFTREHDAGNTCMSRPAQGGLEMRRRLFVSALVVSLFAAACGGGSKPTETPLPVTQQPTSSSTVGVILKNYSVTADPESVPPGKVTFDIKVESGAHSFAVLRTDFPHDKLPMNDVQADTLHEGIELVAADAVSGGPRKLDAELTKPGKYVLLCNVNDHYPRGMSTAFVVTG